MKLPFRRISSDSRKYLAELSEMAQLEVSLEALLPITEESYCDTIGRSLHALHKTLNNPNTPEEIKMLQYISTYANIVEYYSNFFDEVDEELDGKLTEYFTENNSLRVVRIQ